MFLVVPTDRTRGNEDKLKHREFLLNIRKHFFTVKVMKRWHRLPREVAESASLEIFMGLCNLCPYSNTRVAPDDLPS